MHLKLPPPLVLLITLGGMYFLATYWPLWSFSSAGQQVIVLILCLIAAILGLAGIVSFAKASTTVDPHRPKKATRLVTTGIYRFSRNPMYLSLAVLLIAAFFYLGTLSSLVMLPLFVFYMNNFQIEPEEEVLSELFGDEYHQYCTQVRRWC